MGASFEQPNGFSDLDDQQKIIKHAHIQAVQDGLQYNSHNHRHSLHSLQLLLIILSRQTIDYN